MAAATQRTKMVMGFTWTAVLVLRSEMLSNTPIATSSDVSQSFWGMTGRQKALFARCQEGIPAPSGPHLELDGGYYRCGLQLKRNGKPCKELVKIAHPPIVRRSEAFVMPGTRWLSARAARRLLPPREATISQCSANACFLVERTSSPRGMSALGH